MERVFFATVCVIAAVLGSPATQLDCVGEENKCTVTNVDITPCAKQSSCGLKQNANASINFDIQPQFAAAELEGEVSWNGIPFKGLETNACKFTACPTQPGVKQNVAYNFYLAKKQTSKGSFKIKWRVWNKANPTEVCCFFTNIKVS